MRFTIFLMMAYLGITLKAVQAADDCPSGSLDSLRLKDLLRKSSDGENCLKEARNVFAKKYNNTSFRFEKGIEGLEQPVFHENRWSVTVRGLNAIKRVVANFGDFITMISVSFELFTVDEGKDILKQIDQRCSASLDTFRLLDCNENVLDELTNTYHKVKIMRFTVNHKNPIEVRSDNEKLNKFFPNVLILSIEITNPANWKAIAAKFPKVNSLVVVLKSNEPNSSYDTHVGNFFKKNQQIEIMDLWDGNFNFLALVSKYLPNLKILDITRLSENYLNYEGDVANFTSVKDLQVCFYAEHEILENVVFSGLKNLKLRIHPKTGNNWTEIIKSQVNPQIKEFNLKFDHLQAADLLVVPEKLTQLDTALIECKTNFVANDIVKFIEKVNENATYISIEAVMAESQQIQLKNLLPDEWHVTYAHHKTTAKIMLRKERKLSSGGSNVGLSSGSNDESNTGGSSPLVMSHSTPVLAVTLAFALMKLF